MAVLRNLSLSAQTAVGQGRIEVREFGAKGDGATLDTVALQKAIDAASHQGGGTVHFGPGRYLSGTLQLRDWTTLELDSGAVLLGSRKLEDYPSLPASIRSYTDNYTERSLLYADHAEHLALQGRGVIDGQGAAFKGEYKLRPYLLRMVGCRDVLVRDLTLKDSAMWVQHYLACDGVHIDGVTVASKCNANNDGIDIDACQRVRISGCDIQSGDDAIVLKSTLDRPCRHVVITNCLLSSECNAFKLGTESNGGFENIVLNNCTMYDTRLAGIALEMVDGGALQQVSISNVVMKGVMGPIFIRLGDRARPFRTGMNRPPPGRLRGVTISDIQATGADRIGCCIVGLPDRPVENVSLRNLRIGFVGGGKESDATRQVPERSDAYPEYSMFGALPAYAFYCRHGRSIALENIGVSPATADARPSLVCDDIEGLLMAAWSAPSFANPAVVRFNNVRDALIQGCRPLDDTGTYLRVSGPKTARVRLQGNDFSRVIRSVETESDVPEGAVSGEGSG